MGVGLSSSYSSIDGVIWLTEHVPNLANRSESARQNDTGMTGLYSAPCWHSKTLEWPTVNVMSLSQQDLYFIHADPWPWQTWNAQFSFVSKCTQNTKQHKTQKNKLHKTETVLTTTRMVRDTLWCSPFQWPTLGLNKVIRVWNWIELLVTLH